MDNKRFFLVMSVGLLVMAAWLGLNVYVQRKYPQPTPPKLEEVLPSTTMPTTATSTPGTTLPSTPITPAATAPSAPGGLAVSPGAAATVTLGSVEASDEYHVGLKLTTTGAAIDAVTLNEFKKVVTSKEPYTYQTPATGMEDISRVLSTQSVTVDGRDVDVKGANWTLASSDANSATFTLDILRDGKPAVRATKTFRVDKAKATGGSTPSAGYEVAVDTSFTNLSPAALQATTVLMGPNVPPYEIERGPERVVVHAYASSKNRQVYLRRTPVENFTPEKPGLDITRDAEDDTGPLAWLGGSGAYFNAIVELSSPGEVTLATTAALNPREKDPHVRDVATAMRTAPLTLAPGQSSTQSYRLYFGPKRRSVLEAAYYSAYPRAYDQTLVTTSWICSFCTFPWLIRILVGMLNIFHMVVRDWGVAIILLVCVVRLLLHPITRRSQESMKKMAKLQAPLAELKKRYADDKEAYAKAQMDFMKENGAGQLAGCLPMFLQTPIWLALYAGLQSTFELRHQPFLYGFTWIHDLAKPDQLISFTPFSVWLIGSITGINIIPFALAVVFFLQYKLTPKPPPTSDEQAQQQKMMQWMTLIMPCFLYSAPAGLNIYILTSTTFGIIESKIIRDAWDRREQLIAEGKIVLPKKQPRKGGLMQKFLELQEKAEEMKKRRQSGN